LAGSLVLTGLLVLGMGISGPAWDEDSLLWQPRLEELIELGRDYGFEPGSTPWEEANLPDALVEERWQDPGASLLALAEALGLEHHLGIDTWEVTLRVLETAEDRAVGVVLEWGFLDDAVAGADWRVLLERDEAGWRALELARRFHCRRGVSEGLCL
jgi:hypothetical protein